MTTITTYKDLLVEKKRLQLLRANQLLTIEQEFLELKAEFEPVKKVIIFFKKLTTRDKSNSLLQLGTSLATDLIFKNSILSKTGWLTKWVVPYVVKNYSSHLMNDNKPMTLLHNLIKKWRAKL